MEGGFCMKRFAFFVRVLSVFLCLAAVVSLAPLGVFAKSAARETVSYGVNVLSARMDMAVSAPLGNELAFCADDFARALNLSRVDCITVRSLPSSASGELLLGSSRVAVGQTVSGANLSYLNFTPSNEEITHASFTFDANGASTVFVCNMYFLSETNYTPTLSMVPELSLEVFTYRDLDAYGTLSGYDPDGDELVFEIVSYPQNGALILTDAEYGNYVYSPKSGYTGSDRFSYVARDRYGNYSACKEVELRVGTLGTSVTYTDMEDSPAVNAALALTEAGIMSGTQVGNRYYFYPEKTVSRVEFLVMAMHAAGITDVPTCNTTSFWDDGEIPASMKGYVAAAYSMKYISGTNVSGKLCFLPNDSITRAEAAVIVGNIIGTDDVSVIPVFADHSEIPVWASDAIYSLHSIGVLSADEGYISPVSQITRADTARLLASVKNYLEK